MSEREYHTALDAAEAILDRYSSDISYALTDSDHADPDDAAIAATSMREFEKTAQQWRAEDAGRAITADDLLSMADDDEADAIRAVMERMKK